MCKTWNNLVIKIIRYHLKQSSYHNAIILHVIRMSSVYSEGKSCNDCANFDTFLKLGMVEDNHLRIGKSMGDKYENQ